MATLLTPKELAAQWSISVKSIYRLVEQKKLRAVRLPGSHLLRFDPDHLQFTPEEIAARERELTREAEAHVARHNARRRQRQAKLVVMPPLPPRRPKD